MLSRILMWTGVGVALAAIASLAVDRLPLLFFPFLIEVAVYKLAFIAAAGLLAAGAVIGRRFGNSSGLGEPERDAELSDGLPSANARARSEADARRPRDR